MNPVKALLAATVLPMVYACSHPIVIHGEGDVLSESGNRDCTLADYQAGAINCTDNEVTTTYEEVYTGEPKSGWQFRRWGNYCGSALNNECAFFVPGDIVRNFWNATMPPLQAVFRSTTNDGFTAVFMGDSAFEVFATGIDFHAGNASFPEHNATVFVATQNDGSPGAFWNDPVDQASIQTVLDAGDVELLGMTYIEGASSLGDYQNWVEYALQQNLDTRFFISAPWADNPSSMTASEFAADYAQRQQNVHALIDALRDEYPGVDFYTVTTGAAAVELFNLFETGGLADVSALVGSSADALFSDNQGSPGNLLSALGELVWLGAVYDVDLTTYSHSPGFVTDLKSLAQQILNAQDPVYDAPPEVDSDTDGDGIVDRLDPNPEGRPNVLLIMVDDLGYNDLAINNGNSNIDTPNMDQLAQEGVRFTRHYATTVCSPARAAALTGLFPSRLGIAPGARAIPSEIETMPERLQQEGYTTWHIGKWHLGQYQRSAWPDRQGFDHWFGFLNPFHLAGSKVDGELVPAPLTYDNPYLEGSEQAGQFYNGHLEDVLTNRARNVLTSLNNAGAPWFLNLWFFAPHGPITPSSAFAQLYPDTDAGRYRALVNQLDFNVGQILDHLDALGALDNTFVILVSDNGGTTNQVDSNFPFFGVKATATEGALRTPLLMRFPEGAFNGRVIGDIVSIQDLYPTILDVIGAAPASGLDGQSLYTAISQQQAPSPTPLFWEHGLKSYGALSADGQWRLYQPPPLFGGDLPIRLIDLIIDPTGASVVEPPPPMVLAQMESDFANWYTDVHTVDTQYVPDGAGGGTLTGSDTLRTPGYREYTFGLGLPDDVTGQIANQADVWEMARSGDTVTAQFGNIILSGQLQAGNGCHSIAITGRFLVDTSLISGPDEITLALYIDGQEVDSVQTSDVLAVSDPTVPTIIGDPLISTSNIDAPVILNTKLSASSALTISSFADSLCSGP